MAKSGSAALGEGDPAMAAKATELKKELQRSARAISGDEDVNLDAIDSAQRALCALRQLKSKRSVSFNFHNHDRETVSGLVPEEFKCPISKELMRNPVITASGQTFDLPFIQKWLNSGNRTCPKTQLVLSHTVLTPNHLIREMISRWCKDHGVKLPDSVQFLNEEDALTEADRSTFFSLLKKLSSTLPDQKEAAKKLRLLTKKSPSFRSLFGSESSDAIPSLLSPLSQAKRKGESHLDLQEDIITTLLNLSIHDNNKKIVCESPMVIPTLLDSLKTGTLETKCNASAALFTLSALDSNKALIGRSGALKPLIELLDEGHPMAIKDAASAVFNICIVQENKSRAIRDGAVRVIMKKIISRIHVAELLSIVAMLSTSQKAIEEIVDVGGISCLLSVIRETSCSRSKENCIAILYSVCFSDRSKMKEMGEEENRYRTISRLASDGTSRAKRKASGILERINRAFFATHTALSEGSFR